MGVVLEQNIAQRRKLRGFSKKDKEKLTWDKEKLTCILSLGEPLDISKEENTQLIGKKNKPF